MSSPPPPRARPGELGIHIGRLPAGPTDSIVDVPNVRVGHATVWRDEPDPPEGRGTARTGVTAIVPFEAADLFRSRVPAGAAVLNGAGEAIGMTAIREWGTLESPIFLTSTMAIGRVYDAAIAALVELDPTIGDDDALIPVVAECDDGWLNHSRLVQVTDEDVREALASAAGPRSGPTPGGVVGAGTGMSCFEFKGGIGTASRLVEPVDRRASWSDPGRKGRTAPAQTYTIGVLALANFGRIERLTVDGVPVGRVLADDGWPETGARMEQERGSVIVVVATDAPLLSPALTRMATRAGLGLARTGSVAGHGSGDIFLAFSTGVRVPRGSAGALWTAELLDDEYLDPFFGAVVDATEASILDALFRADTVTGRSGHVAPGLPIERTIALLKAAGRISG